MRPLFTRLHFLLAVFGILTLSACSSTYHGRVTTLDGHAVSGASIRALGPATQFLDSSWGPSAPSYVRGTATTGPDGSYVLHASQYRLLVLEVRSSVGIADIHQPIPGALDIIVTPHGRWPERLTTRSSEQAGRVELF